MYPDQPRFFADVIPGATETRASLLTQEEQMSKRIILAAVALLAGAAPAFAHLNPEEHGSLLAGLSHPLFGLDHILAMVAVGLWAAQLGGRATWLVPTAFIGTMMAGFLAGMAGLSLPFVEPTILASVVVLGLLVAASVRLPVALSATLVGVFALFHGHAHSAELGSAGALAFGAGFAASTAALHALGVGLGLTLGRYQAVARLLGAGTAVAGLVLMAG
jgi:urease accessory protein